MKKYKIYNAICGHKATCPRSEAKTLEEAMEYVVNVSKDNIIYDKLDEALFDIEVNNEMVVAANSEANQWIINKWLEEKKNELIEAYLKTNGLNGSFRVNDLIVEGYEEYFLYQNGKLGMSGPFDELFNYIRDYCLYESAAREFFNACVYEMPDFLHGELGNLLFPYGDCAPDYSDSIITYIKDKLKLAVDRGGSAIFAGVTITDELVEGLLEQSIC